MKFYKPWVGIATLLLLTAVVFGRVVRFEFVHWDDNLLVFENGLLQMPLTEAIRQAFGHFFAGDYLPLTLLSFWSDAQVASGPGYFHAVNLALHLANVFLLWLCLSQVIKRPGLILFVCFVFALHPLQVETVAWVSERKGLLCAFFTFLALFAALRPRPSTGWRLAYPFFFTLALLCKTSTLFVPLFLLVFEAKSSGFMKSLKTHAVPIVMSCVFALVRLFAYRDSTDHLFDFLLTASRLVQVPFQMASALGFYVLKFLWPVDLAIIYPRYHFGAEDTLPLLVTIGVIAVGFWTWHKTKKTAVLFIGLWIFLLLLPVLQLVPRLNFVNDRYMYMAIPGFALGLAMIVDQIKFQQSIQIAGSVSVAILLITLSSLRLSVWRSDDDLWQETARAQPWSGLAHLTLGSVLEKEGQLPQAVSEYQEAAQSSPEQDVRAQAFSNLSGLYSNPKYPSVYNLAAADSNMDLALQQPVDEISQLTLSYNLARLKSFEGNKTEAARLLRELQDRLKERSDPRLLELKKYVDQMSKF